MYGLEYLLSPLNKNEFIDKSFGKRAVHIQGEADKFGDLLSWNELNDIVNERFAGNERVKLVYEKQVLPAESFKDLDTWIRRGATLVIDGIHRLDLVLGQFATLLGRDLNLPAAINSYISWPSKQGFDNHLDFHDVFVIQTEGEKRWRVYEPSEFGIPVEQMHGKAVGDPPAEDKLYLDCTLRKGDVLYIPRGHWHYAIAETPSIHLTVGLTPRSGVDFLQVLVTQLMEKDEFFRRDFPVVSAVELGGDRDPSGLLEHLESFQEKLRNAIDSKELPGQLLEYLMISNPLIRQFNFPFESTLQETIQPADHFECMVGQKFLINYSEKENTAIVLCRGKRLELKSIPKSILNRVFSDSRPFSGAELNDLEPDLPWSVIKGFLLQMYSSGIFKLSETYGT